MSNTILEQKMKEIDIDSCEYFESITKNWERVNDTAHAKCKGDWKLLDSLFHGDEPGMTTKEKHAVAWAHFNYQVENGGISQYFGNNFGDEIPYILDALFAMDTKGSNPVIHTFYKLIQQMAIQAYCPDYSPNDDYCKEQFKKYNYDNAVNENNVNYYDDEDFEVEYPTFSFEDGSEFDDTYYAQKIELAKELDKYFSKLD